MTDREDPADTGHLLALPAGVLESEHGHVNVLCLHWAVSTWFWVDELQCLILRHSDGEIIFRAQLICYTNPELIKQETLGRLTTTNHAVSD